MFKAQVLRRGFSLYRRVPTSQVVSSAVRDGHETIHIQRVRFRKPFLSRSRITGTAVVIAGTYGILRWLEEDEEEAQEREAREAQLATQQSRRDATDEPRASSEVGEEGEYDEYDEDDDVLLFLPTGFSRPKPRTYYKGSDPEWQEFRRLGSDRKRVDRIRDDFIEQIRREVTTAGIERTLGKINLKKGGQWIEIHFPAGPPLEYERPGIEVTEDLELRRSSRPVETLHHQKLGKVLVPTAAATAVYTDIKRNLYISWAAFKSYVGWGKQPPAMPSDLITHISDLSAKTQASKTSPSSPGPAPTVPPIKDAQQPSTPTEPSAQKQPTASMSRNPSLDQLLPLITASITVKAMSFRQVYTRARGGYSKEPPRGSILLSGLVEIIGERARMTLDVKGFYDINIGQITDKSVSLRSIRPIQQYPRGGK